MNLYIYGACLDLFTFIKLGRVAVLVGGVVAVANRNPLAVLHLVSCLLTSRFCCVCLILNIITVYAFTSMFPVQ